MGCGAPGAEQRKGTDCPRDDSDKRTWVRKWDEHKRAGAAQGSLKVV